MAAGRGLAADSSGSSVDSMEWVPEPPALGRVRQSRRPRPARVQCIADRAARAKNEGRRLGLQKSLSQPPWMFQLTAA